MFKRAGLIGLAGLAAVVLAAFPLTDSSAQELGGLTARGGANYCLSINGVEHYQAGSASCESEPGGNIALAIGAGSSATAVFGSDNTAVAIGVDSIATAGNGVGNSARTVGAGSHTAAANGTNNRARVIGENSVAFAVGGNNGTAVVRADGSTASSSGDCSVVVIIDGVVDSCP